MSVVSSNKTSTKMYVSSVIMIGVLISFGISSDASGPDASRRIINANQQLQHSSHTLNILGDARLKKKTSQAALKIVTRASASETECLATAVYHEAGGEHIAGKWAVARVIHNRMKSAKFPKTACGVVYQGVNDNKRGCQFSWACDNSKRSIKNSSTAWIDSKRVAAQVLAGGSYSNEDRSAYNALYFHNTQVRPSWATPDRFLSEIGNHRFYR